MSLKFKGEWRFEPPPDGEYVTQTIPEQAIEEFVAMVGRLSPQGDRWSTLELFKEHFRHASGGTYWRSSSVDFAEYDLLQAAVAAAKNAPLFIEAFFDACRSFEDGHEERYAPDELRVNATLVKYDVGFEIRGDRLLLRGEAPPLIAVDAAPPTLAEKSAELIQQSLNRAEELLRQGKGREAVHQSLWLLETVSTAFKGLETENGTVEGRYFNRIVKELRAAERGGTLDRVLEWAVALHGYLSSPTGGGVRHGVDLSEGARMTENAARLFCNLIRSYVGFLLAEHERMSRKT
jgi:hypothetical protein